LSSSALTGLVDFNSATLLMARCNGVNPALSYVSSEGFIAKM